jgi:hypothetical protein
MFFKQMVTVLSHSLSFDAFRGGQGSSMQIFSETSGGFAALRHLGLRAGRGPETPGVRAEHGPRVSPCERKISPLAGRKGKCPPLNP